MTTTAIQSFTPNAYVNLTNKTEKPYLCASLDFAHKDSIVDNTTGKKVSDIKSVVFDVGIKGASTLDNTLIIRTGSFRIDFDSFSTKDERNKFIGMIQAEHIPVGAFVALSQINFYDGSFVTDKQISLTLTITE